MNYVTTNIRLPEEDYLRLKEEAAKKRKSLAAVIRDKVGVKITSSKEERLKWLLSTRTDWFTKKDYKDYLGMRREEKKRADEKYNW